MAGLFDDTEESSMLRMALSAGLLGGGWAGGAQAMSKFQLGQQERKDKERERMDRKGLLDAQLDNYRSEAEKRRADIERKKRAEGIFGALTRQTAEPGQLGSGSFGAVPNAAPFAPMRGGLAGATPEQIAAAENLHGLKLMDAWKIAKEGFEEKPGTFRVDASGQRRYVPDPTKGMNYDGQSITAIPGYNKFMQDQTMATEVPKAILGAAGRLNLRDNPDGTKSPVSEITENPELRRLIGGAAAAPARPMAADADRNRILAQEIKKAQNGILTARTPEERQRAQNDLVALQRETGRLPGYGKTTAQETAEAARKEAELVKARGAAERGNDESKKESSFKDFRDTIDVAKGLLSRNPTASGVGTMMDAAGAAFGINVKGAEQAKALVAVAGWLNQNIPKAPGAQSDAELKDYKAAVGSVGDSTLPVAQRMAALKTAEQIINNWETRRSGPTVGAVVKGYRFKGGDPKDPLSWEKQ